MKKLVFGICLMLSSLIFGQEDGEDIPYYELYWIKTVTFKDNTVEKVRLIQGDPSPEYFKKENITKWDTIGVLSYMGRQVIDSLNKLRVSKGLSVITNDDKFAEDEYGYAEESIFDLYGRRQTPLMVTDFYYDMGDCSCVNDVISEITSHKDIMKRVLSKRNKVLNVCVLLDKKTNEFNIYIQVKRLFTLSYFIGN
jgi:hypothetical protein